LVIVVVDVVNDDRFSFFLSDLFLLLVGVAVLGNKEDGNVRIDEDVSSSVLIFGDDDDDDDDDEDDDDNASATLIVSCNNNVINNKHNIVIVFRRKRVVLKEIVVDGTTTTSATSATTSFLLLIGIRILSNSFLNTIISFINLSSLGVLLGQTTRGLIIVVGKVLTLSFSDFSNRMCDCDH